MTQVKRFILIIFILCLVDDICVYINSLFIEKDKLTSFYLIVAKFDNGNVVLSLALSFLILVSLITFFKYFFTNSDD